MEQQTKKSFVNSDSVIAWLLNDSPTVAFVGRVEDCNQAIVPLIAAVLVIRREASLIHYPSISKFLQSAQLAKFLSSISQVPQLAEFLN